MRRMMPMRNKGELAVMAVCVVVGFLLAAQLRGVQQAGAADATNDSRPDTTQTLPNEQKEERAAPAGMSLIDWEAEWAESGTAMAVGMVAAAAVAIIALLVIKKNAGKKAAVN